MDKLELNELPALLAEELASIDGLNPVTRDIIRGILDDAVTRVVELEADYAEENRLHAEAEARAANLEAQLAAERAAHAWRRGDETPPAPGWYQTAETADGNVLSYAAWDGAVWQGYPANEPPVYWRPIARLPQEPTP